MNTKIDESRWLASAAHFTAVNIGTSPVMNVCGCKLPIATDNVFISCVFVVTHLPSKSKCYDIRIILYKPRKAKWYKQIKN